MLWFGLSSNGCFQTGEAKNSATAQSEVQCFSSPTLALWAWRIPRDWLVAKETEFWYQWSCQQKLPRQQHIRWTCKQDMKTIRQKAKPFPQILYLGWCWKVTPTFKMKLPTSINLIKKTPHRCAQRLVSYLIPDLVKLTTKINHDSSLPSISHLLCLLPLGGCNSQDHPSTYVRHQETKEERKWSGN